MANAQKARATQAATSNMTESALNVYTLPSIRQTMYFLHAAAGFPMKDSWVKTIEQGHYHSWLGIDASSVPKHFF